MMNRRQWILGAIASLAAARSSQARDSAPLRVGMTPAFLHDQHSVLADWRDYLGQQLKRRVEFVSRDSYRETMDLLRQERLEFAWICDYPYIHLRRQVRLLAVPLTEGKPLYRSYLIVPPSDPHTSSITQLRNKVFAFADPYSNTGYLVPRYQLKQIGEQPEKFFARTFFTLSHRGVIEAVATKVAHGGCVDSFVWDTLAKTKPEVVGRTRIAWRSAEFGAPPFVAHQRVARPQFLAMQSVLLGMHTDLQGRQLLERMNLDGFARGDDTLYAGVGEMMKAFGEL
jgi:phosphonate transport system substrate-binding protein